jgi:ribonuclease D
LSTKKIISKAEINLLPLGRYEGEIHLINRQEDLSNALQELKKEKILGFDIETRPAYTRGESYSPSLLQLAGMHAVYLFQLQDLIIPSGIDELLSDPSILKTGVALKDDISGLRELFHFEPNGFVELSKLASSLGYKNKGLRGLTACLLGFRISKSAQTSNWARRNLSKTQMTYAATDAWVGRELYKKLDRIRFDLENKFG